MELHRFRKTDGFTDEALNTRPERQMLALDFLCIPFAWTMRFGVQMALVRPPMIRIKTGEPEGLQQRFQLQKHLVFAAAKDYAKTAPVR